MMSHESGIFPMPDWIPSDHLDTSASVTTFQVLTGISQPRIWEQNFRCVSGQKRNGRDNKQSGCGPDELFTPTKNEASGLVFS